MNWTFGIITHKATQEYLPNVIASIEALKIPEYEIIVVGGNPIDHPYVWQVDFDESVKANWITKKKNLVAAHSCYENMVITHDYVVFDSKWYENFVAFGEDWDVCMNRIENTDGKRFRDWVTFEAVSLGDPYIPPKWVAYDDHSRTNLMYASGTYFCAKRSFMCKNPLNEELVWGMGEDVEWSIRVRDIWKYRCNPKSVVRFLKDKPHFPHPEE